MSARDPGGTLETTELFEGEHIVERGSAEVTWFFRKNDGWEHVSQWPGAAVERLDAGAGTVWQSRVALTVPRGTRLMRVESRPAPLQRAGAFEHLSRAPRNPPRRVRRNYFRVGRGGALEPDRDA